MAQDDGAHCANGHQNDPRYSFCSTCGLPLERQAEVSEPGRQAQMAAGDPTSPVRAPEPLAGGPDGPPRSSGLRSGLKVAIILVVLLALAGAGVGAYLGVTSANKRTQRTQPHSAITKHHPSPSPTPTAVAEGPTLTWSGYEGVYLGENLGDAANALNGNDAWVCPSNPGTYMVVSGLPKGVVISNEVLVRGAGAFNVNVIQLSSPTASGPDGIKAGMTIPEARAASGQPLVAAISPTTGQHIYTITNGNTVFGFYGDPLVSDLTLTTPAGIQQGILGGGGGGGC